MADLAGEGGDELVALFHDDDVLDDEGTLSAPIADDVARHATSLGQGFAHAKGDPFTVAPPSNIRECTLGVRKSYIMKIVILILVAGVGFEPTISGV